MRAEVKIGLFGGSFDPFHKGHLVLARAARRELRLSRVYFVPAAHSPLKSSAVASARDRLNMLRLGLRGQSGFSVDEVEIRRGEISYTIQTLSYFRRRFPSAEFFLILGTDSLRDFKKWRSWTRLIRQVRLVVGDRPGKRLPKDMAQRVLFLRSEMPAVSSTSIREAIRKGEPFRRFVPPAVAKYIRDKKLYRPEGKG